MVSLPERARGAADAVRAAVDALTRDEQLDREVFYSLLGPIKRLLDNDFVTNVEVNENGVIFVDEFGKGKYATPHPMDRPARIALISYLANREFGRSMDALHSELQCDLPIWGSRVQAFAPPISDWPLIIRVHAKHTFPLHGYVDKGEMSQAHYDHICQAISDELNIAVAGSVNSGKTTLLNAMLAEKARMHPEARGVIVQDRREVRADDFENKIYLMARVDQAHNESNGNDVALHLRLRKRARVSAAVQSGLSSVGRGPRRSKRLRSDDGDEHRDEGPDDDHSRE